MLVLVVAGGRIGGEEDLFAWFRRQAIQFTSQLFGDNC